jgi:hypothetical protein
MVARYQDSRLENAVDSWVYCSAFATDIPSALVEPSGRAPTPRPFSPGSFFAAPFAARADATSAIVSILSGFSFLKRLK